MKSNLHEGIDILFNIGKVIVDVILIALPCVRAYDLHANPQSACQFAHSMATSAQPMNCSCGPCPIPQPSASQPQLEAQFHRHWITHWEHLKSTGRRTWTRVGFTIYSACDSNIGWTIKKVFHKSEGKVHKKMKMTLQRAENLVHVKQHYSISFFKKYFFLFWFI